MPFSTLKMKSPQSYHEILSCHQLFHFLIYSGETILPSSTTLLHCILQDSLFIGDNNCSLDCLRMSLIVNYSINSQNFAALCIVRQEASLQAINYSKLCFFGLPTCIRKGKEANHTSDLGYTRRLVLCAECLQTWILSSVIASSNSDTATQNCYQIILHDFISVGTLTILMQLLYYLVSNF